MKESVKNERSGRKPKVSGVAREIAYLALGVALLTVCAFITVPVGAIPVTLQTFGVALVGALFGAVRGGIVVSVYFIMGLIGIPVFAGFNAGVTALMGPTGGYLLGFLFSVVISGLFSSIRVKNQIAKTAVLYVGMIAGLAVCYFFGTLWFVTVFNRGSADPVSVAAALMLCVVPYLLPDAVKLFFAAILGVKLKPYVKFRKNATKKTC